MLPAIQPPIVCAAANYNPHAPRGSLRERLKLVKGLERRILQSTDALELQNRLRQIDDGQKRVYMLPYHVLLTKDRFRLGVSQPEGYYSLDRHLSARHLRDVKTAQKAEQEIAARIHEYALNPDLAWEYVSSSNASFTAHCIKEDLLLVVKALCVPLRAIGSFIMRS